MFKSLAAAAILASLWQSQPAEQPRHPSLQPWPSLASSQLIIEIPAPITSEDIDRYARFLNLSEPQQVATAKMFQEYKTAFSDLESRFAPRLLAAAARVLSANGLDYAHAIMEERNVEHDAALAMAKLDQTLFGSVDSILAEVQKPQLERVRLHRQRAESRAITHSLPKAEIDLSAMIERLLAMDTPSAELDLALWDYEKSITPLIVDSREKYVLAGPRINLLMELRSFDEHGNRLDMKDPEVQAQRRARRAEIDDLLRDRYESDQRIARVNDDFFPKLIRLLPREKIRAFRDIVQAAAYPNVYPDPNDPEPMYMSCVEWAHHDQPTLDRLSEVWNSQVRDYHRICNQLCKESDVWQKMEGLTDSTDGWAEHRDTMLKLLTERGRKARECIDKLHSILPADVTVEHKREFDTWKEHYDQWLERLPTVWEYPRTG